eukprot:3837084-Alexandrium_andersonii.AAC.1
MRKKARVIIKAAVRLDCDVLILSAFGRGAFGNPPEQVAAFFKEALDEVSVESTLCEVIFCIVDDHNSRLRHNPNGNAEPFKQ